MKLVKNKKQYWEFIRNLRNLQKESFVQQEHIFKEEHERFMGNHGKNYYICLIDKKPAGFVGCIKNDIRVATHPGYYLQGVGRFMISEMMKIHSNAFAKVKIENGASLKLFESCGFKKRYYILEK